VCPMLEMTSASLPLRRCPSILSVFHVRVDRLETVHPVLVVVVMVFRMMSAVGVLVMVNFVDLEAECLFAFAPGSQEPALVSMVPMVAMPAREPTQSLAKLMFGMSLTVVELNARKLQVFD